MRKKNSSQSHIKPLGRKEPALDASPWYTQQLHIPRKAARKRGKIINTLMLPATSAPAQPESTVKHQDRDQAACADQNQYIF